MAGIVSLQSDTPMEIQPLDIAAVAIIAAATLRGMFIGLIREGFSLAALGGAYMAVQLFTPPAAEWLQTTSEGNIGPEIAPWVAGASLAIVTVIVIVFVGRGLQRTLKAAGLSWADRFAGSMLGAAEGVLVAGILLVLGTEVLGRDHAAFSQTASLAALEGFERVSEESEIDIDVAAPPRTF
jgi:membrane protein required for colicin V production